MLNLISLLIGIPALIAGIVAFTPLLGWANWLVIPFAIVGAAIGALSDSYDTCADCATRDWLPAVICENFLDADLIWSRKGVASE